MAPSTSKVRSLPLPLTNDPASIPLADASPTAKTRAPFTGWPSAEMTR